MNSNPVVVFAPETSKSIRTPDSGSPSESVSEATTHCSFPSWISDSETTVVSRPTSEKIPTLEEVDTLTSQEFDQILIEAGIENY